MALTVPAIVSKAAEEANNILGAVPGLAAEGAAQYIKQGTPSGVIPNVGVALARQACRRWAQQPGLVPDAVDAGFERVCRPYLDDIGYGGGPTLDLPFRGGQCCGVTYQFTYTFRNPNTGQLQDSVQTASNVQIVGLFERSNQPAQPTKSGGPVFRSCSTGQTQQVPLGTTFEGAPLDQSISNISIIGGAPDNCGNPPVVITPPTAPPGPVIDIDPIIVVPILDIDAGLTINVDGSIDITVDGVEITIDPFGDGDGGGGGPGGGVDGGDLVPDGGTPGDAADTGDGGTAEGEAPPGQELVGVRVEVLESPVNVNTYDRVAVTVFRGIGYVRMGYPGRLALDMGGAAVISPQFFLAPVRGLTNWEVRANNGFINRVTPFYRELPS